MILLMIKSEDLTFDQAIYGKFSSGSTLEVFTGKNVSLALNGSLESWTVESGGSDSRDNNSRTIPVQIYLMTRKDA